jgi:hypothetical protein
VCSQRTGIWDVVAATDGRLQVLDDSAEDKEAMMQKHLAKYPNVRLLCLGTEAKKRGTEELLTWVQESDALRDTAVRIAGTKRTSAPREGSFVPIGHVAIRQQPDEDRRLGVDGPGLYWITTLYISWMLQKGGLGRAAVQNLEIIAQAPPYMARTLLVDVIPASWQLSPMMDRLLYEPTGVSRPPVSCIPVALETRLAVFAACGASGAKPDGAAQISNEEWWSRQGFEIFSSRDQGLRWVTREGPMWLPLLFMRKPLAVKDR